MPTTIKPSPTFTLALFKDIMPVYLKEDSPFIKKKFAMYILVDMIENLGYENIAEQFPSMMQTLMAFTQQTTTVLRQSACFGIGMAAKHCPEGFKEYLSDCIDLLKNAVKIEKGDQDKEEYLHCKDNAISSIGKIIKHHRENDEQGNFAHLFLFWLSSMPLKMDLEEAKEMNQFLAEECINNPELVFGESIAP